MPLNLVQHRDNSSVWDRSPGWDIERWVAAMMAGGLIIAGVRRRSIAGLLMFVGGSALAWWAAAEIEVRQRRRGKLLAVWPSRWREDDSAVAEASEESFPASDAPAWTPTMGNTGPARTARRRRADAESPPKARHACGSESAADVGRSRARHGPGIAE